MAVDKNTNKPWLRTVTHVSHLNKTYTFHVIILRTALHTKVFTKKKIVVSYKVDIVQFTSYLNDECRSKQTPPSLKPWHTKAAISYVTSTLSLVVCDLACVSNVALVYLYLSSRYLMSKSILTLILYTECVETDFRAQPAWGNLFDSLSKSAIMAWLRNVGLRL